MAKVDRESSTVTWIWLWDALALLMQFYPRVSAEQKLVRAIALRAVGHKRLALTDETVVTVSTQGVASVIPRATASDLPIWRKLASLSQRIIHLLLRKWAPGSFGKQKTSLPFPV